VRADLDPGGGRFGLEELDELADDLVEIAGGPVELTDPHEPQEVFENGFEMPAFALHGLQLAQHAAIAG